MNEAPVLSVEDLRVHFSSKRGPVKAVDGVSLELRRGETLGVVGESGSGKTVTALSVMRLLPEQARMINGRILFAGRDLAGISEKEARRIRGNDIGMVFQDPMTSLNPFLTVGEQVAEPVVVHTDAGAREARSRAVEMLEKVGIPDAAARFREYPHRFSGGMRQRVMIAMALINRPKLLIADEPTTALDVTIQAQVLELFRRMTAETGTAVMLITHNLGIVAGMADRVAVMYAGRIVEYAGVDELFSNPRHPYTVALLRAVPRIVSTREHPLAGKPEVLQPIAGGLPNLSALPRGCAFFERCEFREGRCRDHAPPLAEIGNSHAAACWVDICRAREHLDENDPTK